MRFRWWRRRASAAPRADRLAIAVLEHDLYGEQPAAGSTAELAIALRAFGKAGVSVREMKRDG